MTPKASTPCDNNIWSRKQAPGRWYALGRWYAMFPQQFVSDAIRNLTTECELILDPFCGRGNAPFVATVLNRPSVGIDIHPLAWLWTQTKLQPDKNPDNVIARVRDIGTMSQSVDHHAETEFEEYAWCGGVRAFLRTARQELDWRDSITDRTTMAFIALQCRTLREAGLSNQLSPTVAFSPDYAVKWWTARDMTEPPDVDPVSFLESRIRRRYKHGVPTQGHGTAVLGDARLVLKDMDAMNAAMMITSPPYHAVTDYWNDHWIRLWMLGYDMGKDWGMSAKYGHTQEYKNLIVGVLKEARRHLVHGAAILMRCDKRPNHIPNLCRCLTSYVAQTPTLYSRNGGSTQRHIHRAWTWGHKSQRV